MARSNCDRRDFVVVGGGLFCSYFIVLCELLKDHNMLIYLINNFKLFWDSTSHV